MKRCVYKKITYFIGISMICAFMSGCSLVTGVDLTEEQSDEISEYAAGLLLKYEKGHKTGIARNNDLDIDALYVTPTPTPIVTPEPEIVEEVQYDENGDALVSFGSQDEDGDSYVIKESSIPLNKMFGLDGANLEYSYYELRDAYPESEDELVFAMNAALGKKLLVLHFNMVNITGSDSMYTTMLDGYKVRAVVNGDIRLRSEITFLPNDLLNFSGTIPAGMAGDVVLIYEVPEETDISTLSLRLVKGTDEQIYTLE